MSYQNVGNTPRFYVNVVEWLGTKGVSIPNVCRTLPVGEIETMPEVINVDGYMTDKSFIALLNHDLSGNSSTYLQYNTEGVGSTLTNIINQDLEYNGYTISKFSNILQEVKTAAAAGSIIFGTYYDMNAPDLSLTMSREYGGVKTTETKGGSSLTNAVYINPSKWGDREAWQLGNTSFELGGRRTWNMSFSFIFDSELFPPNPSEMEDAGGWEIETPTPTFLSEVLRKVNGSQLPFIFQPNTDDLNFAICKFVGNSFNFQQKAPNMYSLKIRIREVW